MIIPPKEAEPLGVVLRSEGLNGIGGHRDWWRDLGQQPAVRPPELQRAVARAIHLVALFVDGTVDAGDRAG